MKFLKKLSNNINIISIVIGNSFIVLGLILIFIEVILRYLFNFGFRWIEEITCFSFAYVAFLGASVVLEEDNHMRIDVFTNRFPGRIKNKINLIFSILIIIFLIVLTYEGIILVKVGLNAKAPASQISMALPYFAILLGSFFMLIQAINNFFKGFIIKRRK
ncbi:hypothetical protein ES705_23292 [subsurface metagenome]|jgi:TRAP-type C4-dicarboxylate transport system permease small subunit|nr:TRAP transporter small permease subunit [Clostridia bacterium]RXG62936.1 MAG: TRAP transporter small permease subunit [Candidatus Atribacteria bacterium 1244-E10-H5-B2]